MENIIAIIIIALSMAGIIFGLNKLKKSFSERSLQSDEVSEEQIEDNDQGKNPSILKVKKIVDNLFFVINVYVVNGHEYIELRSFHHGYGDVETNCVVHSESCLCHQGKHHCEVDVVQVKLEKICNDVYMLTYNGHDYLVFIPGGILHASSCDCQLADRYENESSN